MYKNYAVVKKKFYCWKLKTKTQQKIYVRILKHIHALFVEWNNTEKKVAHTHQRWTGQT